MGLRLPKEPRLCRQKLELSIARHESSRTGCMEIFVTFFFFLFLLTPF